MCLSFLCVQCADPRASMEGSAFRALAVFAQTAGLGRHAIYVSEGSKDLALLLFPVHVIYIRMYSRLKLNL